jgi:hypothetical protein
MIFEADEIRKVVASFNVRASAQKRQSHVIVAVLTLVVLLAFGVFFFAPRLTGFVDRPAAPVSNDNTVLIEYYKYVGRNELSHMIAVLAVRVTVTVTLLFFIQILWSLYRYYSRLSVYYSARADCLLLIISHLHKEDGLPTVGDLIRLFSPSLDFGKATSPADAAVDLAGAIVRTGAAQKSKGSSA